MKTYFDVIFITILCQFCKILGVAREIPRMTRPPPATHSYGPDFLSTFCNHSYYVHFARSYNRSKESLLIYTKRNTFAELFYLQNALLFKLHGLFIHNDEFIQLHQQYENTRVLMTSQIQISHIERKHSNI